MCVQNFDDSRGPAIRITYRISRHPLLKVVIILQPKEPREVPVAVWVQFIFHLVMGGTKASQPTEAGAYRGT